MTIGPAPMIRIDLMSVRLGIGSAVSLVIPGRREGRTQNPDACTEVAPGFRARPLGPSRNNRKHSGTKKGRAAARPAASGGGQAPRAGVLRPESAVREGLPAPSAVDGRTR